MAYSVKADWQKLWNEVFTEEQFDLMNAAAAVKINTVTMGKPGTDVPDDWTDTAKDISDDMMEIFSTFLKESSMTEPPEFIHYKIPHFTPLHMRMINEIKTNSNMIGIGFGLS